MNQEYEPIAAPPGWTAEQDIQEYVARFGDADNYFEAVQERIEAAQNNLNEAVDLGLRYFGEAPIYIAAAELPGKILALRGHLLKDPQLRAKNGPPEEYVSRFEEHLRLCQFAHREYVRLAPMLDRSDEQNWLFPLYDLCDWMNGAALQLEEGLDCEHPDFRQVVGEPDWQVMW
jgi:hypothetical protein